MYRILLEHFGTSPAETLVVGDRLETDIAGGQALGSPTALVLSGVTDAVMAASWKPQPEYICSDLNTLITEILR